LVVLRLSVSSLSASRPPLLPAVLTGDTYVAGSAVSNITAQLAQLIGFAAGGTIVAGLGVRTTLLVDAATFALSAALVRYGVRDHQPHAPAVTEPDGGPERPGRPGPRGRRGRRGRRDRPGWWEQLRDGAVLVWRDARLRYLIALACVSGFYVTVEALAVPYAAELGHGAVAAGLLFAANPAGQVLGMLWLQRRQPATRIRLIGPLAIASCLPLVFCALGPGLTVTLALWMLSGVAAAYQLPANTTFVLHTPQAQRGQAFGLARTALIVAQGAGVLLAGLAAERWSPSTTVAAAGVLGALAAAAGAAGLTRALQPHRATGRTVTDPGHPT
jgi:predicted MFS family arabinose efflux permease